MVYHVAAIDVGASSGRVMLAAFDPARRSIDLQEVHRFENHIVRNDGHDCWDFERTLSEIVTGLNQIEARGIELSSIGVDTWAVDYVLLDADGRPIGPTVSYRDHRTDGMMEVVQRKISREEIYARTGIQFLQFNTLYQLQALFDSRPAWINRVARLLLVPDYLHFRLCGAQSCEYTNATATQLLNIDTGDWDEVLLAAIGAPRAWFLPPQPAGSVLGHWRTPQGREVKVIAPATHDTGSAVAAAPLADAHTAYISSGTWSLMGIESRTPVKGPEALRANITNEGGVEGTYRVLKNIMGLWLLQRVRIELGVGAFADLVDAAAAAPAGRFLINPNDDSFLNPPVMIRAIRNFCRRTGQGAPATPGELARCVLDSLALLYRQTMQEIEVAAGMRIALIQIIGGGSNNRLLNQLTADYCQVPVETGPVEASALGNVCYQLKGLGLLRDLAEVRELVSGHLASTRYEPAGNTAFIESSWQRFLCVCRGEAVPPQLTTSELV